MPKSNYFKLKYISNIVVLLGIFLILTSCSKFNNNAIQGYIEARYTYVASNAGGRLQELLVSRGKSVKTGQLLFSLEEEPEISELNQAKMQLDKATQELEGTKAALTLATLTVSRKINLEKVNAISIQNADEARSGYKQAESNHSANLANLKKAQAALDKAAWLYKQKKIYSIKSGIIYDTFYLPGELVPVNNPVVAILAPEDTYIVFYVAGNFLGKLKLDQKIKVKDQSSNKLLDVNASISFIAKEAEYTPPVIYSNDTNSKLVFRIEAKLAENKDKSILLHPGQPVDIIL